MFALLSAILTFARNAEGMEPQTILSDQNKRQFIPYKQWVDLQEKSFSTQLQTSVRAPFGPNPQQYLINNMDMLKKPKYQESYQRNIRLVQPTGFIDWRLDPVYNSELNQYADFHTPEGTDGQIQNFNSKRRKALEGSW